ncbi:hypothetical protein C8Q80DRAFT_513655 [Daedaleopsis nitida]|nr:hypothetical protein C8Q80DRAFT_513655 [Daedaleopsis nitida]
MRNWARNVRGPSIAKVLYHDAIFGFITILSNMIVNLMAIPHDFSLEYKHEGFTVFLRAWTMFYPVLSSISIYRLFLDIRKLASSKNTSDLSTFTGSSRLDNGPVTSRHSFELNPITTHHTPCQSEENGPGDHALGYREDIIDLPVVASTTSASSLNDASELNSNSLATTPSLSSLSLYHGQPLDCLRDVEIGPTWNGSSEGEDVEEV